MRMNALSTLAAACLAIATLTAAAQHAQPPAYENAIQVLTDLEDADDLRTFTSLISYTTIKDLGGALTQRTGEIAFASTATPAGPDRRRFAVRFDTLRTGDRYFNDQRALQTIAFDGRFLWEKLHGEKQINKREIVRQGQSVDPFELGDGPFPPLPIGQQKDDILRRYDVRLVPAADSLEAAADLDPADPYDKPMLDMALALESFAEGSVQLLLIPKASSGEARFAEIRLWYKPDDSGRLVPRMSRTVDANSNDVSIVQLMHPLQVNGPAREDLLTITPEAGWTVNETPLPPPAPAPTTPRDTP